MYKANQYRSELNLSNTWLKYDSPANLDFIVSFLVENQWIPSQTTIERAIAHLGLQRTDGRTARDDARDVRAAAQRSYDAAAKEADRPPLTREELDEFSRLSMADLQRLYYGEDGKATDFFSVRYRKASREHGFRIPPPPTPPVVEDKGEVQLSAEDYRRMPSRELQLKLRQPAFKMAVMRLIANKEI
jgi:hypothetical protein